MMVFRIRSDETRNPAVQPPSSGRSPIGCNVVSKAKTTEASSARDAPANMAAIPTSAQIRGSMPNLGNWMTSSSPRKTPQPPPMVKSGANVPPDVPLPSEIDQETNFMKQSSSTASPNSLPVTIPSMLS